MVTFGEPGDPSLFFHYSCIRARPPSSPVEALYCCQAGTSSPAVLPKIFFNEILPLTCGFVLDAHKLVDNSGKSVLGSLGGGFVLFDDDGEGVGRILKDEGAAARPDHGVLRCACRKPDTGSGDDDDEEAVAPLRTGKRSAAGG